MRRDTSKRDSSRPSALSNSPEFSQVHPRAHDAVNRLLLAAFRPELGDPDAVPQRNGCFNVLLWCGDRFTVLTVNEEPRGLCGPVPPQA
jgi:hypothetical protein